MHTAQSTDLKIDGTDKEIKKKQELFDHTLLVSWRQMIRLKGYRYRSKKQMDVALMLQNKQESKSTQISWIVQVC